MYREFKNFEDFIKSNQIKNRFYDKNIILNSEKKKDIQKRKKERIENKNKLTSKRIDKLLNSDIDFSKFGWVQKAADLLEMKSQKISNWMKKNMKEFHQEKCFNRDKIREKHTMKNL